MTRCVALLCLVASAAAAEDYDRMLDEARHALDDDSRPMAERFEAQYEALAKVALAHPRRWEAFFERGVNRCNRAFHHRTAAEVFIVRARAEGMDAAAERAVREEIAQQIERWRVEAHREFSVAENAMVRLREWRPDHEMLIFANASMKFAGGEYLRARNGQPGAIEDFKALVRRNFLAERCADHIALCYLDVGHDLYVHDKFEDAQQAWDEGLKWVRQPGLRQLLLTNKAGAYELDHQYALAEAVLERQIADDPLQPAHHRNLGLVLGYQNRLKEALYHYGKARELCGGSSGRLALLNGNAWLRASVIHGTLLENEGDVLLAWRLFLEYRQLFGDDYNFSLWFADFAAAQGQYDLAWLYLVRARDLQPRCSPAYQKLAHIAPRTKGTREEVEVRTKAAAQALLDAQARYFRADETAAVLKICGGVADLADVGFVPAQAPRLEPDPLGGFDAVHPPPWVEAAARSRDPFVPFEPAPSPGTPAGTDAPVPPRASPWALVAAGVGALFLAGAATIVLLFRRGRGKA